MICKHCGAEVDDKATLCIHCGKLLKEKSKAPIWLIILLWCALLPIMAIITIVKNKTLSQKAKAILITAIILVTVLCGVGSSISNANTEKTKYEEIVASVENKDYENAQDLITDFISQYPNSEYLSDINTKKETVDAEVLKIENERKEKEKQEKLEKEKNENAQKANISVKAFENMIAACKVIGIEYENMSSISPQNNWAYGKRCSFNYSGYQFLVYFNQDETVNSVNSGNIKFYENGKMVEDPKNRLISTEEQSQLKTWAETHIKNILKSPSSAEFPGGFLTPFEDWSFAKNGTTYTVSSYVDAQNGFGAMIRSHFTITYEWKDETGKVTSLFFDGKKMI